MALKQAPGSKLNRAFADLGSTNFQTCDLEPPTTRKGTRRERATSSSSNVLKSRDSFAAISDDELLLGDDDSLIKTPQPLAKSKTSNIAIASQDFGLTQDGLPYDPLYPPKPGLRSLRFKKNKQSQSNIVSHDDSSATPEAEPSSKRDRVTASSSTLYPSQSSKASQENSGPKPRLRPAYLESTCHIILPTDKAATNAKTERSANLLDSTSDLNQASVSDVQTTERKARPNRKTQPSHGDGVLQKSSSSSKAWQKAATNVTMPKERVKRQIYPLPSPLSSPQTSKYAKRVQKSACPLDSPLFRDGAPSSSQASLNPVEPVDEPTKASKRGKQRPKEAFPMEDDDAESKEKKLNQEPSRNARLRVRQPFPMDMEVTSSPQRRSSPSTAGSSKRLSGANGDDDRGRKKVRQDEKTSTELDTSLDFADITLMQADVDPETLCPYCDEPLPPSPTKMLRAMFARLRPKSWAQPRPGNSLGLKAPITMYVDICVRHRFERHQLPMAEANGWPTRIDFDGLPTRIRRLRVKLERIVEDKQSSHFWKEFDENLKAGTAARFLMGVRGQYQAFTNRLPGYYGEEGSTIILQTLHEMFPDSSIDPALTSPMRPGEFIENILAPEVAVALIRHDLKIDVPEALQTMKDSAQYGTAMFPDLNVGDTVGDKMMKERARARRHELNQEENVEGYLLAGSQKSQNLDPDTEADSDAIDSTARIAKSNRRAGASRKVKTQASKSSRHDTTSAVSTEDERQADLTLKKAKQSKGKSAVQHSRIRKRLGTNASLPMLSDEELEVSATTQRQPGRDEALQPTMVGTVKQAPVSKLLDRKMNPLDMARSRKPTNRASNDPWKYTMSSPADADVQLDVEMGSQGRSSDTCTDIQKRKEDEYQWLMGSPSPSPSPEL